MPYKDKEQQKQYQNNWYKSRRESWIQEHGPCKNCGSCSNLQVDHINPYTKIDHKVWSWKEERRLKELAKCQVLCKECHYVKTAIENNVPIQHGCANGYITHACRCGECKHWQKIRMKIYKQGIL